mmetsp:Transcript_87183/g.154392  ORF Transcript_87183/g.154392 Transcript_87183/m.154392 type:complete len:203 (-) Transcript_87183:219-827(-)
MYGGQTDEDRERSGVSSIIATRLFESRMKQLETVGRRPLPKIRRKPKPRLQVKAGDLQAQQDAGHEQLLDGQPRKTAQEAQETHVIDPWWLSDNSAEGQASRKSLSLSLSPRERKGSRRSLEDANPTAFLPRPALPKLPNAASAACWPAGQARWRWPVPQEGGSQEGGEMQPDLEISSARSHPRHGQSRAWWELQDGHGTVV